MLTVIKVLRLGRGGNDRQHWRAKLKSKNAEREAVAWELAACGWASKPALPCVVTITRVSPGNGLDDDNLTGSCKHVRDEVAAWLRVDDGLTERVRYLTAQERGPWAVRIKIETCA